MLVSPGSLVKLTFSNYFRFTVNIPHFKICDDTLPETLLRFPDVLDHPQFPFALENTAVFLFLFFLFFWGVGMSESTAVLRSKVSLTSWCLEWLIIWLISALSPLCNDNSIYQASNTLRWFFFLFHLLTTTLEFTHISSSYLLNIDP